MVAASAVITKDVLKMTMVAGVPAIQKSVYRLSIKKEEAPDEQSVNYSGSWSKS